MTARDQSLWEWLVILDCYFNDAKAHTNTSGWKVDDYLEAIDDYRRAYPSRNKRPVAEILKEISQTGKPRPVAKGGEVWTEPHGYYDGLWWRGSWPMEQLGYVEGYLAC